MISFFRFVTIHAFDRQTDGFLLTRPPCVQCSAVKTEKSKLKQHSIVLYWPMCCGVGVASAQQVLLPCERPV